MVTTAAATMLKRAKSITPPGRTRRRRGSPTPSSARVADARPPGRLGRVRDSVAELLAPLRVPAPRLRRKAAPQITARIVNPWKGCSENAAEAVALVPPGLA